jgi:putative transposase
MPEYRRIFVPGGTYFFTVITYHRQPLFLNPNYCRIYRKAVLSIAEKHPFEEVAYCILPDHIHTIWTMPEHDSDYPLRWQAIKGSFTRWIQIMDGRRPIQNSSHLKRREAAVWQRRYWEHLIFDDRDFDYHMDYIHYNPVALGLVNRPIDWKWSSFLRFVEAEYYESDWGENEPPKLPKISFGE